MQHFVCTNHNRLVIAFLFLSIKSRLQCTILVPGPLIRFAWFRCDIQRSTRIERNKTVKLDFAIYDDHAWNSGHQFYWTACANKLRPSEMAKVKMLGIISRWPSLHRTHPHIYRWKSVLDKRLENNEGVHSTSCIQSQSKTINGRLMPCAIILAMK